MKFYHGTTQEYWNEIQKEGVLWGSKNCYWYGNKVDRVTWFAKNIKDAGIYNDRGLTKLPCVILEVDFPNIKSWDNWQMVSYNPIPLNRIKIIYKED